MSRNRFFKRIGADPKKKLITYCPGTRKTTPHVFEILDMLWAFINRKKTVFPSQLLVRIHPKEVGWKRLKFTKYGNLIIDIPGKPSKRFRDGWIPFSNQLTHLANLMYHSDVVINVASTVTLDACVLNTPVINISFDETPNKPYYKSIRRFHDFTHYRPIVASGAVRIARNPEDLLNLINIYLLQPSLDSENRKKLASDFCYKTDGKSAIRIGEYLLKLLNEK